MAKYTRIDRTDLPTDIRWDVPRRNQGQSVEVAYAHCNPRLASEADDGDTYKRVTDRSDGSVEFYKIGSNP